MGVFTRNDELHDNGVHLHCAPAPTPRGTDRGSARSCHRAGRVEQLHSHDFDGTENTITSSSGVTCDDCGDQLTEPTRGAPDQPSCTTHRNRRSRCLPPTPPPLTPSAPPWSSCSPPASTTTPTDQDEPEF